MPSRGKLADHQWEKRCHAPELHPHSLRQIAPPLAKQACKPTCCGPSPLEGGVEARPLRSNSILASQSVQMREGLSSKNESPRQPADFAAGCCSWTMQPRRLICVATAAAGLPTAWPSVPMTPKLARYATVRGCGPNSTRLLRSLTWQRAGDADASTTWRM